MTILTHINHNYAVLVRPCPARPNFFLLRVMWSTDPLRFDGMTLYARVCPEYKKAREWFNGLRDMVDNALDPDVEYYTEEDLEDYLYDLSDKQAMYSGMSLADLIDNED